MSAPTVAELPSHMAGLPRDKHGRVVPWFVAWLDRNDQEIRIEDGSRLALWLETFGEQAGARPDFRVVGSGRVERAIDSHLCWLCGHKLGRYKTFVIGPMCAINRTSSEPPSHSVCARYAAQVCPFLTRSQMRRRDAGLPPQAVEPAGVMLRRNPGVTLLWTTTRYHLKSDGHGGILFDIGDPHEAAWYRDGRPATRAEVLASIDTGLPALWEMVDAEPTEMRRVRDSRELTNRVAAVKSKLLPDAPESCDTCNGSGVIFEPDAKLGWTEDTCPACHGNNTP